MRVGEVLLWSHNVAPPAHALPNIAAVPAGMPHLVSNIKWSDFHFAQDVAIPDREVSCVVTRTVRVGEELLWSYNVAPTSHAPPTIAAVPAGIWSATANRVILISLKTLLKNITWVP